MMVAVNHSTISQPLPCVSLIIQLNRLDRRISYQPPARHIITERTMCNHTQYVHNILYNITSCYLTATDSVYLSVESAVPEFQIEIDLIDTPSIAIKYIYTVQYSTFY